MHILTDIFIFTHQFKQQCHITVHHAVPQIINHHLQQSQMALLIPLLLQKSWIYTNASLLLRTVTRLPTWSSCTVAWTISGADNQQSSAWNTNSLLTWGGPEYFLDSFHPPDVALSFLADYSVSISGYRTFALHVGLVSLITLIHSGKGLIYFGWTTSTSKSKVSLHSPTTLPHISPVPQIDTTSPPTSLPPSPFHTLHTSQSSHTTDHYTLHLPALPVITWNISTSTRSHSQPAHMQPPHMALFNVHSLLNKSFIINDLILENKLDCLFLTETWLSTDAPAVLTDTSHQTLVF